MQAEAQSLRGDGTVKLLVGVDRMNYTKGIPRRLLEASADLGAGQLRTFRRVVLPLSLPGTVAGTLFVFVLSLGDFVTPQMVGGTSGFTIGRLIWSQFGLAYNWPLGSAMAAVLFVTALTVIVAAGYAARRELV